MTLYETYAARGRNAWWRYVLTFLAAPVVAILATVVIILPLQLAGIWSNALNKEALDPGHPIIFFLFNGAVFLVVLAAFAAVIALVNRKRPGDIVGRWGWTRFGAGFAVWSIVLAAGSLIDWMLAPSSFHLSIGPQTPSLALAAAAALTVQTFTEEFVFRGYLTQGLLLATRRMLPTALISGLLFGALHIPNGWPQAANATVFGVVLAIIAMRTGGLAFTYGLHLANNLFGAVIVVSAADAFHGSPGVFTQNAPGMLWWDAAFGGVALILVLSAVHHWIREPASHDQIFS